MRTLVLLALVGLDAQLVDGSLGMAYGVTSSTLLAGGVVAAWLVRLIAPRVRAIATGGLRVFTNTRTLLSLAAADAERRFRRSHSSNVTGPIGESAAPAMARPIRSTPSSFPETRDQQFPLASQHRDPQDTSVASGPLLADGPPGRGPGPGNRPRRT